MQDETNTTRNQGSKANGKWKAAAQEVTSALPEVENQVSGLQDKIMTGAKQAFSTVSDKAADAFSGFNSSPTTYIRQYPIQAAIGGVVVGLLLGAAISRRAVTK